MIFPDTKVVDEEKIIIKFDYPLGNPTEIEFESEGGFTRYQFWNTVKTGCQLPPNKFGGLSGNT